MTQKNTRKFNNHIEAKSKDFDPYKADENFTAYPKGVDGLFVQKTPVSLSIREAEVLCLLARGLRTGQIAHALGISNVTVDMHIRNSRKKLGATTREHAITLAMHHKLISPLE